MQIVLYLLLALSICLETAKNVFSNIFSKNVLKNETDIYKFNFFLYSGSVLVLLFFKGGKASLFTVALASVFAVAIWLNQYFFLKALRFGSMSFTTFIQGTSLIVPIIFAAVVWNEKVSVFQIVLLAVLILSMALSLNIKKDGASLKWLLYSSLVMLFLGIIGIVQTVHQSSDHSDELISFLRCSFIFSMIINLVGWQIMRRREKASFQIKSAATLQACFSGAFMGAVHILNLYLAGRLPEVIFFPIINGGLIFVTLVSDLVFFKEKLNFKQWIGILAGTAALCFLGL